MWVRVRVRCAAINAFLDMLRRSYATLMRDKLVEHCDACDASAYKSFNFILRRAFAARHVQASRAFPIFPPNRYISYPETAISPTSHGRLDSFSS